VPPTIYILRNWSQTKFFIGGLFSIGSNMKCEIVAFLALTCRTLKKEKNMRFLALTCRTVKKGKNKSLSCF
jgi:hypothetical protein